MNDSPSRRRQAVTYYASMPDSTVLVVDDDPVILKLLEVNFEMEGFNVLLAQDGTDGIEVARRDRPDIIVSDIMMPRQSGLELVAELKGDPSTSDIPIILLSAKAQNADVRSGMDAGADDYITKPFEPLDLVDRVNRLLSSNASKRPS
jgi:DNA-binding response OmpR family regulator